MEILDGEKESLDQNFKSRKNSLGLGTYTTFYYKEDCIGLSSFDHFHSRRSEARKARNHYRTSSSSSSSNNSDSSSLVSKSDPPNDSLSSSSLPFLSFTHSLSSSV